MKTFWKIILISFIISLILFIYGYINHIRLLLSGPSIVITVLIFNMFLENGMINDYPIVRFFRSFNRYFFIDDEFNLIKKNPMHELIILLIGVFSFLLVISVIIPFYRANLEFLVNSGISLILLGATFSILSFNYSVALKEENKEIIIASGKRFLIATFYAVIFYGILVVSSTVGEYTTFPSNFNLFDTLVFIYKPTLNICLGFVLMGTTTNMIYLLLEGFLLLLRGTIKYQSN